MLLGVLGLVPAIDVAVALVNHIVTRGFRATLLPALELRGGIPADLRTLVAVPTLLTSLKDIEEQIERLEIHYLASPRATFTSRCCPIGAMRQASTWMGTTRCWPPRRKASPG